MDGESLATIPWMTAAAPQLVGLEVLFAMDMEAQPPAIGDGDVQGKLQIPEVPTCDPTKAWDRGKPLHVLLPCT